jgi:hypothetical protein
MRNLLPGRRDAEAGGGEDRQPLLPRPRFLLRRRAFRGVAGPSTELHNYRMTRGDGVAMGIVNASVPFLPVFIARLGGSPFDVSLLTAIPAISGFLLAIPIGQFLQSRRRIVPWYARSRMVAHFAYGLAAIAVFFAPPGFIIPVILVIWALAAVPATIGIVSFYVVMDGAAGPRGRYELMSRRWAIMGLTTAITVAVIGLLLERLPFPVNYQLVFVGFTLAGLVSYYFSSQFHIPQADPPEPEPNESILDRFRAMVATVRGEPAFVRFSARQIIHVAGVRLVLPLIPLYYVRVVDAPDAWIGIIATGQSLALLAGYILWRRASTKRGGRFVLLASLVVAAVYPAALSLTDQLILVAILAAVGALFTAGVDLALFDELMKTIPRRYGVTFASIDTTLVNAAGIVAPLIGATLAVIVGIENALRIGSLISLVAFVLFALDARKGGQGGAPEPSRASA